MDHTYVTFNLCFCMLNNGAAFPGTNKFCLIGLKETKKQEQNNSIRKNEKLNELQLFKGPTLHLLNLGYTFILFDNLITGAFDVTKNI